MLEITEKYNCSGCYACKSICPRNAISMVEDDKGFKYPQINYNYCINCGLCEKVCPIINPNKEIEEVPKAYAANNIDIDIRMQSSSGGIFTLIAENIIKKGGVVFGAVFNEEFLVEHAEIHVIEDLFKVRGAKYIQSDIKTTYKNTKKYLEDDKFVLFSGTPCQIEGLKLFLAKDYDKLYTQDLICHGVPSKLVWNKYLKYREKEDMQKPQQIYFRNKEREGWNNYELLFKYEKYDKYIKHKDDIYMKIFLNDIALRDSCYKCHFKKRHRISDITLADFWGINNVLPEINDEKGTSLIIVNTLKGEQILNEIKSNIKFSEVDFEMAIKYNPSMTNSPKISELREEFFKDLDILELEEIMKKYIDQK